VGNVPLLGLAQTLVSSCIRLFLFWRYKRSILDLAPGSTPSDEQRARWNAFFAFQIIAALVFLKNKIGEREWTF
jgi:hypothetical protein